MFLFSIISHSLLVLACSLIWRASPSNRPSSPSLPSYVDVYTHFICNDISIKIVYMCNVVCMNIVYIWSAHGITNGFSRRIYIHVCACVQQQRPHMTDDDIELRRLHRIVYTY